MTPSDGITRTSLRVRYAETDQMGVAYHTHYLVWCEYARTEHLRSLGMAYRDLEAAGLRLAVVEARVRYRAAARYDDVLDIWAWVREVASRRVTFGYAIRRSGETPWLATASTALLALDSNHALGTLPPAVRERLHPIADPVRL